MSTTDRFKTCYQYARAIGMSKYRALRFAVEMTKDKAVIVGEK